VADDHVPQVALLGAGRPRQEVSEAPFVAGLGGRLLITVVIVELLDLVLVSPFVEGFLGLALRDEIRCPALIEDSGGGCHVHDGRGIPADAAPVLRQVVRLCSYCTLRQIDDLVCPAALDTEVLLDPSAERQAAALALLSRPDECPAGFEVVLDSLPRRL